MPSDDPWGVKQSDNAPEYSVSDLSAALKKTVEDRFGYVRVRAELSGVKIVGSGHCYFALKDQNAVLDGVMWRGSVSRLPFRPEDGLEVVCAGKLTTYAARSKYQMVVDQMEPAGAGALMALLEERKKKLAAEGLFDQARKKPVPYLPMHIGVVTSPTGAVIRDILHRLNDRFPIRVSVWPVKVQGEGAADAVAHAIDGFNKMADEARPDTLIVARGGGSIEDLWSFNEEIVVRAAACSTIPLISAVGHETDTTLVDYAADRRAPTPTAAAEMAVPVRDDLIYSIADFDRRLGQRRRQMIDERRSMLSATARALPRPKDLLGLASQRLDDTGSRLPRALTVYLGGKASHFKEKSAGLSAAAIQSRIGFGRERLNGLSGRTLPATGRFLAALHERLAAQGRVMDSLSHERVLERGFALVADRAGQVVTRMSALEAAGGRGYLRFADGEKAFEVDEPADGERERSRRQKTAGTLGPVPKRVKKQAKSKPGNDQGSLF